MSHRQQSKKACFAAFEKSYRGRMNRKYRHSPGYMGVTSDMTVNGEHFGRGVMFVTDVLRSKPFPRILPLDDENDGDMLNLGQQRTRTFDIQHEVVAMPTTGLPKTTAFFYEHSLYQSIGGHAREKIGVITGKFSTVDVNYDALKLLFPDTDGCGI